MLAGKNGTGSPLPILTPVTVKDGETEPPPVSLTLLTRKTGRCVLIMLDELHQFFDSRK